MAQIAGRKRGWAWAGLGMDNTTLLRVLLSQRHLRYETFCAEYEKAAADVAPHEAPPSRAQFYRWLSGQLKGGVPYPDACRVLEAMFPPWTAADLFGPYRPGAGSITSGALLEPVAAGFDAGALAGPWATCYEFLHHGEARHHHADIAHVEAVSERQVRAVNHPPEPRSEGRARPFRNEVQAQLAGRHLVGTWRNTSDTRYLGAVQLAVLPGETMMDGWYTGVGSDIEVSAGRWRWARIDPGPAGEDDLAGLALAEPAAIYDLLMSRTQYDALLTPADLEGTE